MENLPAVDRTKGTGQQKRRIHQIILSSKEKHEEVSLYDIDQQPFENKFRQTIGTGWTRPVPSLRTSTRKSHQKEEKKEERATS